MAALIDMDRNRTPVGGWPRADKILIDRPGWTRSRVAIVASRPLPRELTRSKVVCWHMGLVTVIAAIRREFAVHRDMSGTGWTTTLFPSGKRVTAEGRVWARCA